MGSSDSPRIDRALTLDFQGDWGQANLHRICGWLAQEVFDRSGPGSRTAIWTGRGGADAVDSIATHAVDLSMIVPAYAAHSAREGVGMWEGAPHPELRALGVMPQDDRLVFAVGAEHGIRSFADLREMKVPLVIATSQDDGVNTVGYAVNRVMEAHGIPRDEFLAWGGSFVEDERPFPPLRWYCEGRADAVFHEAIMTPPWQEVGVARATCFIPMEDGALTTLEKELGWPRAVLRGGYLPGCDDDLLTLDFSSFLVLVHEDMPDDVAYLLTWCMVHTAHAIERQYHHIPSERSPLNYPFEPDRMRETSIPLHPAAARVYDELGGAHG
ncbi:MAG TPA: TAXI family TRAP transporter solute-binding subunit [Acidimicrobiales bacterium]|nr:TAXI family TRAP transporter solute-binding subunit [Acidimicrobiales bacterium]